MILLIALCGAILVPIVSVTKRAVFNAMAGGALTVALHQRWRYSRRLSTCLFALHFIQWSPFSVALLLGTIWSFFAATTGTPSLGRVGAHLTSGVAIVVTTVSNALPENIQCRFAHWGRKLRDGLSAVALKALAVEQQIQHWIHDTISVQNVQDIFYLLVDVDWMYYLQLLLKDRKPNAADNGKDLERKEVEQTAKKEDGEVESEDGEEEDDAEDDTKDDAEDDTEDDAEDDAEEEGDPDGHKAAVHRLVEMALSSEINGNGKATEKNKPSAEDSDEVRCDDDVVDWNQDEESGNEVTL
eukprot:m.8838 g.8838  ORF g.8838 m.8838 type:complete len:299 (-) comp5305_c0_seq1:56-952(-)